MKSFNKIFTNKWSSINNPKDLNIIALGNTILKDININSYLESSLGKDCSYCSVLSIWDFTINNWHVEEEIPFYFSNPEKEPIEFSKSFQKLKKGNWTLNFLFEKYYNKDSNRSKIFLVVDYEKNQIIIRNSDNLEILEILEIKSLTESDPFKNFFSITKNFTNYYFGTKTTNYQYLFSSVKGFNNNYSGIFSIYANREIGNKYLLNYELITEHIFDYFSGYFHEKQHEIFKYHAIKSAKAAIMSRNMSHNLGSHVMFYLKNKLENVHTLIKEDVLRELIFEKTDKNYLDKIINKIIEDKSSEIAKVELPFLIGLGKFINYLQERQDFLATISTGDVPYFVPLNFKDSIFDELNIDYKALRHDKTESYKAGCKNILLSYIAKSEGLDRNQISIEFEGFDGLNNMDRSFDSDDLDSDGHIYKIADNHKKKFLITKSDKAIKALQNLREFEASFPGGIIGRQAFFSIIENFIRNSAKHSFFNKEKLRVLINIDKTCNDDLIKIIISNNLNDASEDLIKKLEFAINEEYIQGDGTIKENNKGIKEMRISAAWLRNYSGNEKFASPPILAVKPKKDKDEVHISYEFYLQKPWKVGIITNKEYHIEIKSKLKRFGWDLFTPTEFKMDTRTFRFIAIDNKISEGEISVIRSKRINIDEELRYLNLDYEISTEFLNNIYLNWYEHYLMEKFEILKLPVIYIKDKQELKNKLEYPERIEFTESWLDKYKQGGAIIFKDHLISDEQLNKVWEEDNDGRFIESITGTNSTSRLIRNEKLNKEWYCKTVESAYTNVLIIDERLWNYFSGQDEKDYLAKKIIIPTQTNKALCLKNITVCNILPISIDRLGSKIYSLIDTLGEELARFAFIEENKILSLRFEQTTDKFNNRFDFISMHMSLYDKLRVDHQSSINTFSILQTFEKLLIKLIPWNSKPENHILVHTGKSKPANDDLFNKYKYLPFASIENAIKDCKFSLSEILYSAK